MVGMGQVGAWWIQEWTGWGKVRAEMGEGLGVGKVGASGFRIQGRKS
jgi:hypothetical protein